MHLYVCEQVCLHMSIWGIAGVLEIKKPREEWCRMIDVSRYSVQVGVEDLFESYGKLASEGSFLPTSQ